MLRTIILCAAFIVGTSANAGDDDISPGLPLTFFGGGVTAYLSDSGLFSVAATPIATQFSLTTPPRFIAGVEREVMIDFFVAPDGGMQGGIVGDDFLMIGMVDEDNDGTVDYSGILLSGNVTTFQFLDTGSLPTVEAPRGRRGGRAEGAVSGLLEPAQIARPLTNFGLPTDIFEFRIAPTGGTMLDTFAGSDIGVALVSENSTFTGDFSQDFSGNASGNVGPIPSRSSGACCLTDGSCVQESQSGCDAQGGTFQGDQTECSPATLAESGCYRLIDGPGTLLDPPTYAIRLDELFDATPGLDQFTFSVEAPGTAMFLCYDGADTVRIFGTAFGGLDIGGVYDPAYASMIEFDFTYTTAHTVLGDDDLIVTSPDATNTGTVRWLETGQEFALTDKLTAGQYAFRFGDDDNDQGFNGFDGYSGFGWLMHDNTHLGGNSDFIFSAVPLCD